jgi:hypothetical protein
MGYGRDLPHDLAQYVIEAATGYEQGFWGLVAMGATFKSPVRAALDRALVRWRSLTAGDRLVFEWPSAHGVIERAIAATG